MKPRREEERDVLPNLNAGGSDVLSSTTTTIAKTGCGVLEPIDRWHSARGRRCPVTAS